MRVVSKYKGRALREVTVAEVGLLDGNEAIFKLALSETNETLDSITGYDVTRYDDGIAKVTLWTD